MASKSERNLLFAVFALQHALISSDQLIAATSKWARDKTQSIDAILLGEKALDAEEVQLISTLVDKHLSKHKNDGSQSLVSVVESASQASVPIASDLNLKPDSDLDYSLCLLAEVTPSDASLGKALGTNAGVGTGGALGSTLGSQRGRTLGGSNNDATTMALTDASEAEELTNYSRFTHLRDHARGGLGIVSVALDEQFNREVAVKSIRGEYASHEESQQRFFQEATINGCLEHPGIVPVYALGRKSDGQPFYAMRFIRGESLKRILKRIHANDKPLKWDTEQRPQLNRLLSSFTDACNAVAYAHSRGVIHRDLKPSNIMIGKFGETLVVDWGLAKSIGRDGSTRGKSDEMTLVPSGLSGSSGFETRLGQAIGTPHYMSPEQASGNLSKVGVASDIFNLGATFYEILTGRAPFIGEEFEAIENCDFLPPRQVNPSIDPALEAICLKAMAKRPSERYISAEELNNDVESWQADMPVSAYAETSLDRGRRWMRKNQSIVASSLAAMLVFAVSLGLLAAVINASYSKLKVANDAQQLAQQEAERNAAIAREQSGLALEALNSIVFNVQNRLRDVPAASTARRELLQMALDGLSRVSAGIQLREGIARNQSQALLELGEVFVSIGDDPELGTALDEGTKLIERATEIREDALKREPSNLQAKRDLCHALGRLGDAAEKKGKTIEAGDHYARLMQLSQELANADGSDENLTVLAEAYGQSGDLENRVGSSGESLGFFEKSTEILRQLVARSTPANRNQRLRRLADAYNRQGTAHLRRGDLSTAENDLTQSLQLLTQIDANGSGRFGDNRLRSRYLINLGKICFERRKYDQALEHYQAAFELRQSIANIEPANAMVQQELANCHTRMGEVLLYKRDFMQSLHHYTAAKDAIAKLADADPNNESTKELLSQAYTNIAGAHFSLGDPEESLRNHKRSLELSEEMVRTDPNDASKLDGLAVAWLNTGMTYDRLGEAKSAIEAYTNSSLVCNDLYKVDPADAKVHSYALQCYFRLAELYEDQGEDDNVLATYRQAILFGDKILERNPANSRVKAAHAELKGYFALFQNDLPRAAEAAREFGLADPENINNLYNSACIYALCVAQADDAAQKSEWRSVAIASLQKCVDAGYDDFENLRDDTDLAVLRNAPEFKNLFPEGFSLPYAETERE